jgi:hypothetical protein
VVKLRLVKGCAETFSTTTEGGSQQCPEGRTVRIFLGLCALVMYLGLGFDADGHEVLTLDCGGDWDCEVQSKVLCDTGHIEWCVKEA